MSSYLWMESANLIEWDKATDEATDAYLSGETTGTFRVEDSTGTLVSGASGTMSYVAGSSGKFQGVVPSTVTFTENTVYYVEVELIKSASVRGKRRWAATAKYKGAR